MRRSPGVSPASFTGFGAMLKYLRRRSQLTQRDLALAVGYSVPHLCRLEQNQRLPDLATLLALFVPALDLEQEPEWVGRLLELAAQARGENLAGRTVQSVSTSLQQTTWVGATEPLPTLPAYFVARRAMLALLRDRLALERALVAYGLAGSGKTTLLAALAREVEADQPVFWLTFSTGINTSVDALLRQLAVFLVAHGAEQAQPLLETANLHLALDQRLAIVGAALASRPALLCLDNVQLIAADPALLNVLRHLIATTSASVVFGSREPVPLPDLAHVRIEGLTDAEGRQLIAAIHPALEDELVAHLLVKTAAHPMFLRLALAHLHRWDGTTTAYIEHLELQPHIAVYLINGALQGLDPAAHTLLLVLAVFRQPLNLYDPDLLEQCAAGSVRYDLAAALPELQQRCLIDHPARATLHPLLHDHVSTKLDADPRLRERLQRIVAEYWEQKGDFLAAAPHWCRAGAWQKAVDAVVGEGRSAADRGLGEATAGSIDAILALVRRVGDPARGTIPHLLIERGICLTHSLRAVEAEADFRAALAYAPEPPVRVVVLRRLAENLLQRGLVTEALALTEEASASVSASNVLFRAALSAIKTAAMVRLARYSEALDWGRQTLELADQIAPLLGHEADLIRGQIHGMLGIVQHIQRNVEPALAHWNTAVAIARRGGMRQLEYRSLSNIALALYESGDLAAAIRTANDALQQSRALADSYSCGRLLYNLSLMHHVQGEWSKTAMLLAESRTIKQRMGDGDGVAAVDHQRATLAIAQGEVAAAEQLAEKVLAQPDLNERLRIACLATRAAIWSLAGDLAESRHSYEAVLQCPATLHDQRIHCDSANRYAVVLLALGATAEARAALAPELPPDCGLEIELERELATALLHLAAAEPDAARKRAQSTAERAQAAGYTLYARTAARLIAATHAPPQASAYPRLLWVDG
ncbi:MAG: helix-turn-helix domain-containing protein [Herpetosiphonaceae bacterium]|nr:helix-turn-helix domain-containing protein [Herpetosiphonaceae bacterium]